MQNNNDTQSEAYVLKEFISQAYSYKYFYLFVFSCCFIAVLLINKLSPTIYEANSIIGPVEDKRSSLLGSDNLFSGLDAIRQNRNLENDINSLTSFSLVSSTIKSLNLEIGYFKEKNKILGQTTQIYQTNPYIVNIDKSHSQPINTKFNINILDQNSYRLTSSENEVTMYNYVDNNIISEHNVLKIDTICRFNETINNRNFKFSVSLNNGVQYRTPKDDESYYFEFYHLDLLAKKYLGNLKVEAVDQKSSLINVFFKGKNINLTIDFLNRFLETYLDENLAKKNKIALNTVNFIDSQISEISDSLLKSESNLRDYRSINQVTDISYQGQKALEQMTQIDNLRSNLQIQERYYNYVLDYFSKNQDLAALAPPSAANVVDPIMNQLILELLALNAQKSTILSNNTEKNLFLGQLDNKIKLQKQAITEYVKNSLNTLNLNQNELNARADKVSREISRLPRTELNMVSMQRKFNLSDAIYTFLLQKQSEAAITMASNYPDYEILEPARSITSTILSPKKSLNWLLGIFIALAIPTCYILLMNFFNDKISSVRDAENLLNRSVLSLIYSNNYKTDSVVSEFPGSAISESFRNLRSSLFLKFRSEPRKVILVTSSQPKDGKSFISFNLAASIASVGHKTIIMDCDLRRPTLHDKFKEENSRGLSNFMVDHLSMVDIIHKTNIENLDFIPSGPVLPNSSEMIEAGILDKLIDFLKNRYDYVIIDTTPIGLVADASLVVKYASHVLLVCRNNYTRKDIFSDVLNMFQTNKIENFDVIFNDLSIKNSRYGRYDVYYKKEEGKPKFKIQSPVFKA